MTIKAPVGTTLLASEARTTATSTADQVNLGHSGVHVVINVSAISDTPSITPTIEGKDPASGSYYSILVGSAITATGMTVLKVGPGITPVANGAAADFLPAVWRVSLAVADADSATYSVAANLVS